MRSVTLLTALLAAFVASPCLAGPAEDFAALLRDEWEWRLRSDPMFASENGDRRYNDQWQDNSLEAIQRRVAELRGFLRRLYAIDRNALPDDRKLDFELFRRDLQERADEHGFKGYLMPFLHDGGVQNLEDNATKLRFATVQDFDDWLARLDKIDDVVEQTILLAERGRETGFTSPKILMERIPDQVARQLVDDPESSPFWSVFAAIPDDIPAGERERIRAAARATISKTVLPAYRELDRYFRDTYLPAARESVGLASLPGGAEWYEFLTRRYTTSRMTPDEIHRLGLEEVKRIRGEMDRVIETVGFDGGFEAFLQFLRNDPQFYYSDPDALYEAYLATSKRIDPELVRLFGKLPRMPYGVKPIPESVAPDTTTAYYTSPAADGSRAGIYWVNLYRPEVRPKYEIEVLTVHEAMPGHHLQLALQQEMGDMPDFRRYGGFTAFVEGWGLYSEALGYDLGLYTDPYSRFGQLTYEMWRAVRLVVDTGLHYKGWTRDQAIDFFRDNAAKTELDIINEIDRYIGDPGQALAYKIGQLKMRSLRTDAEVALGKDFDIRAFHDAMLGAGALPLDLLETRMNNWLAATLAERRAAGSR